jgi:hypothetical protein
MELQTQLKSIADKIDLLKDKINTEESTKHAFILPFINALGYDSFNPIEVVPEFTADLGLKKGEKVDYAIFQNSIPILIIECQHWKENLDNHNSQLLRYFHTTKARFALLTNGIDYKFYTDLEHSNKMDEKPFLEFKITHIKDIDIHEIAKFHKSKFDVEKIITNASSLKYTKELKKHISNEMKEPSSELVRLLASRVYSGRLTEKVMLEFSELVHKAFNQTVSEKVSDRLNAALHKEEEKQQEEIVEEKQEESKIVTTEEELDAYRIIVAILRRKIPVRRITYRDTQSYFGILLDDNNRKPLCRLHFNGKKKYIGILDINKKESKECIEKLEDIYHFEDRLLETLRFYIDENE